MRAWNKKRKPKHHSKAVRCIGIWYFLVRNVKKKVRMEYNNLLGELKVGKWCDFIQLHPAKENDDGFILW